MKVFAYSLKGVHLAWSDVDAWKISGGVLTMWRGKAAEVVTLPSEVIGLHDDGPHRPAPPPGKYKREEASYGTGETEWDAPQRRYGRQRARHA